MLQKSFSKNTGQALIISIVFLAVLLGLALSLVSRVTGVKRAERRNSLYLEARAIAEAGINKAIFCLGQSTGALCGGSFGINYAGESNVSFGQGSFTTTLVTRTGGAGEDIRDMSTTGYIPNASKPEQRVTINASLTRQTTGARFHYGLQVGVGGLSMEQNTTVNGNIFSNGSIQGSSEEGSSQAQINGDALVASMGPDMTNQAAQTQNTEFRFGYNDASTDIAERFIPSEDGILTAIELNVRRVGNPDKIYIYVTPEVNGKPFKDRKIGEGILYTASAGTTLSWIKTTLQTQPALTHGRSYWIVLNPNPSSTKYWYTGADTAHTYPHGTGKTSADWQTNTWADANVDFNFRVHLNGGQNTIARVGVSNDAWAETFTAGSVSRDLRASSTITNATIGRDAYAYQIDGSTVGRDAYATIVTRGTVGGRVLPGTGLPAPSPQDFPITDEIMDQWKQDAATGGIIAHDYTTTYGNETRLGPTQINGNLLINTNSTLTLTGTIYVTGTITIQSGAHVRLDPSYGTTSGVILADNGVDVGNNVIVSGSGSPSSYLLLLATGFEGTYYNSAVYLRNTSQGLIVAAPKGTVRIDNNVQVKQISAFSIYLKNNAIINYESGLANVLFSAGPGGSWHLVPGTWHEVQH